MRVPRTTGARLMALLLVAAAGAGCAGVPRGPEVLPTVGDVFRAPYDAVWDATLRSLGVVRLVAADKAAGWVETEPFPYTYFMTRAPRRPRGPALLAARDPRGILLAQDGFGDNKITQVVWISLRIALRRVDAGTTRVDVEPRIHHSLLPDFLPGPTNNPWVDLFAKIRSALGLR